MSFLGKMAKLDSAMQRGLDNSFAFVFGGRVVPAEIEELLKQQAEDNVVRTYEGDVEAPNVYVVNVSRKDFEGLKERHPRLPEDFADRLTRYLRNQGWATPGPVAVTIVLDTWLRTGQLNARSEDNPRPRATGFFTRLEESEPSVESNEPSLDAQDLPQDESHDEPWGRSTHSDSPLSSSEQSDATPGGSSARLGAAGLGVTDLAGAANGSAAFSAGAADAGASREPEPARRNEYASAGYPSPATEAHPRFEEASASNHLSSGQGARPRGTTVTLLLQDGSSRTYLVREGSNIIGRSHDADLRLPDTGVSRQHAEITWNGEDAVLTDLRSTNGTTVNGTPIENWLLADGDVITVGHSHIEVRIVEGEA